jgi:hypothetical protein
VVVQPEGTGGQRIPETQNRAAIRAPDSPEGRVGCEAGQQGIDSRQRFLARLSPPGELGGSGDRALSLGGLAGTAVEHRGNGHAEMIDVAMVPRFGPSRWLSQVKRVAKRFGDPREGNPQLACRVRLPVRY